jgi:CDP-paratose 2-epimerase
LLAYLEQTLGIEIPLQWSDWRPGDQPVFVCDLSKARECLVWGPQIGVQDGVRQLIHWVQDNERLFDWVQLLGSA